MARAPRHPGASRGFTLAELLVATSIAAIAAASGAFAFARAMDGARLAESTNGATEAIAAARAMALRDHAPVAVVFRPRHDGGAAQRVHAVLARWSGDVTAAGSARYDRFVPVAGALPRPLAAGISVAGPAYRHAIDASGDWYGRPADLMWVAPTWLPGRALAPAEAPGELVGVMFGPGGESITRRAGGDTDGFWVDFDRDGAWDLGGAPDEARPPESARWELRGPADEPLVNAAPFLAVFDEAEAREMAGADDWRGDGGSARRAIELSEYLSARAERIHFNRYTGAALR
jgi:prepilin-type N-terminal cleavage/methylation domain-containing protein